MNLEKVVYTAKAHTTGGRENGASRTSDGRLDVKLSTPGQAGTGTSNGTGGGAMLGAQAGEAAIRSIVLGAGFSSFRRAAQTPFNLVYEAKP